MCGTEMGINLFGSRTLWWCSLHERKESWSPDVTLR